MDNSRQYGIISEEEMTGVKVIVIGCGAGGSWVTYMLAKLGISDIEVYDDDIVGEENIRAQLFGLEDVGNYKVEVLYRKISRELDIDISFSKERVVKTTELNLNLRTIVLNMVDSIDSRKVVFDLIKGFPTIMIDCRMGGEGWQITTTKCDDEDECLAYEKSLEGEFRDMPCGEQAVVYSTVSEAAECVNLVKKIIKGENYNKLILRDMKVSQMLGK